MRTTKTIDTATDIQKMFGSNYYTASRILPKNMRDDVIIFYAFVRLADEIVDNPPAQSDPSQELLRFRKKWKDTYSSQMSDDPILEAFAEVCWRQNIDFAITEDFLDAMEQDLSVNRYDTYTDLQSYMYGSAEVIGLILLKIFGCHDERAIVPARALGEAMQFTNFIRDIHEDYVERDRIYIPQSDLQEYQVSETDLVTQPSSSSVRSLMAFEVKRAEEIFGRAVVGISLLPKPVQPAVRAAAGLYLEILQEIKRKGYSVQTEKIRFSKLKKLTIALLYAYVRK